MKLSLKYAFCEKAFTWKASQKRGNELGKYLRYILVM